MKLVRLQIKDLRKLSCVSFDLKENGLNIIAGDNEAGKSTVSLAVRSLLEGSGIIPADAVQHGSKKAEVIAETSDGYIFKEVIKADGTATCKVTKDDMSTSTPRKFLDSIKGRFFDVRQFGEMPREKKVKYIMSNANINYTEIDNNIKLTEQERLITGRQIKNIGTPEVCEEVKKVNVDEYIKERNDIVAYNVIEDDKKDTIDRTADSITSIKEKIEAVKVEEKRYESALEQSRKTLDIYKETLIDCQTKLDNLPAFQHKEFTEIDEKISKSSEINEKATKYENYKKTIKDKKYHENLYKSYTEQINEYKQSKLDKLKDVKMPLEGLELTETDIIYNGITSENWSDSQALEISAAIAAHFSGKLRTIIVRNGEAFGKKKLERFAQFCEEQNIQCIIEIVEDDKEMLQGDNVWFIEDGEIK